MKKKYLFLSFILAGFTFWGQSIAQTPVDNENRGEDISISQPSIERAPLTDHSLQPGQTTQGLKGNTVGYAWNILPGMSTPPGPVFVNLTNGSLTSIKEVSTDLIWMSGADMVGDTWYAVNHHDANSGLYIVNPVGGSYDLVGATGYTMTGLAWDVTTETLFASGYHNNASHLYTINLNTGAATLVGQITAGVIIGIAADAYGNIYGINLTDNSLHSINPNTGAGTHIGALGISINFAQDIAFDRDSGTLYGVLYSNVGGLYSINTSNGNASHIGFLYTELAGFAIPYSTAPDGAPAAVSAFTATAHPTGDLQATLSWTNPTTQVDGSVLTSLSKIYIERDAVIVDSIVNPVIGGAQTWVDNDFTEAGSHLYSLFGMNDAGNGTKTFRAIYVGQDVPAAPGDVTLVAQDNDGLVTWSAPTEGFNGGSFDGQGLYYSVTRMPDNILVTQHITETQFLDDVVPVVGYYYYIVTAYNAAGKGGQAVSNQEMLNTEDVLLYEPFNYPVDMLPSSWQLTGTVIHNWKVSNTFNAGGTAPELRMHWASPANTGLSRVVSDPIDVEDVSMIHFTWKMYLDSYNPGLGEEISIDVSFDNGDSWSHIWEEAIQGDIGPGDFELFFDVPEGETTMKLGFRFEGVSNNITQWCIDEVLLKAVVDDRLTVSKVVGKKYPTSGKENIYQVTITNTGFNTIDDYTVKLMKSGLNELATIQGQPVAFGESITYELTWTPEGDGIGPDVLYGYASWSAGDETKSNLSVPFKVNVLPYEQWALSIGDQKLTEVGPLVFPSRHSLQQTLYYPHEIAMGGGQITAIEITNHFNADLLDQSFTIWMGETELTDLTAGWIDPASLQQVFSGLKDFPAGVNDILINLDEPYQYGGENLVIYFFKEAAEWSGFKFFHNSEDPGSQRTRRARRNTPAYNPLQPPATGTTMHDVFPNITMIFSTEGLGSIQGTVTDGFAPISGVNVSILETPNTTTTAGDGTYSFLFLAPGSYDIEFIRQGYDTLVIENVVIVADQTTTANAVMTTNVIFSISGYVQGNDGVLPEGAQVMLEGFNDYTALTNAQGEFMIDSVFMGLYTLTVMAEGYDVFVQENVMVDEDLDLGMIEIIETIVAPSLLFVDVDDQEPGEALFSWIMAERVPDPVTPAYSQSAAPRGYPEFNVFLDGDMVATGITETEYLFTSLGSGSYTAGVQSVYTTGTSEIITIDFEIEITVPTFPVTFTVTDQTEMYQALRIKGEMTDPQWMDINLAEGPDHIWSVTLEVLPGTYDWGIIEDDGSEHGIWLLPDGVNLEFTLSDEGAISGDISYIITGVGVGELQSNDLVLFPNPARDQITLQSAVQISKIQIMDITGRIVYSREAKELELSISTGFLESGIYFVKVVTASGHYTLKLQVQK